MLSTPDVTRFTPLKVNGKNVNPILPQLAKKAKPKKKRPKRKY